MSLWQIPDATIYPGASQADLDALGASVASAPSALLEFWREANGALFGNGVHLYSTTVLPERNDTWEVAEYCPGYLAVGDNSGGRVFLMKAASEARMVFESDSGDMDPTSLREVADDFSTWVRRGCPT